MPSSSQAIRVEGQDATNGMFQQMNQTVRQSVDAIQEVSVQTSNFAAEYGQVGGGYINYTMKSGTNQLHGSAYDYFQNEALNAGTPFTNNGSGGLVKNPLRRNDYGFTLGGPVRIPKLYNGKDKTFFFFNFEQFRQNTVTNNLTNWDRALVSMDRGIPGVTQTSVSFRQTASQTQAISCARQDPS